MTDSSALHWPDLDWTAWRGTATALQLRLQMVGKLRLALTPWLNHSWHVPFYVTARGLATSPMPVGSEYLEGEFDLIEHRLELRTSRGEVRTLPLVAGATAAFYADLSAALRALGLDAVIDPHPSEMPGAARFDEDRVERPYDRDAVHRFWRALLQVDRVFKQWRSGFLGKASPVHVFWGSFDLAATRFSGKRAPLHPGGAPGLPDDVTREAYSHEEASAGFWPGGDAFPQAAFYAYAYPAPSGYAEARVAPEAAHWDATLGEFILPYDAVRQTADPEAALTAFLDSTYAAAADLGHWDRAALECAPGRPGVPRAVG